MDTEVGQTFLGWVQKNEFDVVVWDMDCTMSSGHCGAGLPFEKLGEYIVGCSSDFIAAVKAVVEYDQSHASSGRKIHFAVATGSDPYEYNLPGQSTSTHILGPDLARAVIEHHCPEALYLFEFMIGFDCRLHTEEFVGHPLNIEGKRHHMRSIQQHFNVPFKNMVLIDDSASSLVNEDGWSAVKVNGKEGFKIEHVCM